MYIYLQKLAMSRYFLLLFLSSSLLLVAALTSHAEATKQEKKAYIVYMGESLKKDPVSISSHHKNLLNKVITSDDASERLIHSYTKSFNALAAMLSEEEANKLSNMDEVVSFFPNQRRELHTTRSWDFMGFPSSVSRDAFESEVIIGMLDTGIWPESKSFDDAGFGPPPCKWNGTCQTSEDNFCNKKIIGARHYHLYGNIREGDIASPRDTEGHGTHTSSTAAGRLVANASLSGLAEGTARGAVPSARLAVYKVCWENEGCYDIDLLAGFEDAIADGVDIISISIGSSFASDYFQDPIAIGSFHAAKNGILVSASAGNSGPGYYSVVNVAPWMLTVAASTIDRKFIAQVELGDGQVYQGMAVNTDGTNGKLYPLVYAANVPNKTDDFYGLISRYCFEGTLDGNLSRNTVLICDWVTDGSGPQLVGAVGAIMRASNANDYANVFKLPVSVLGDDNTSKVISYATNTSKPKASVVKSEGVFDSLAPSVVSFSSRGPNPITYNLLKPDLAAPGVDIIAAWSPLSTEKSSLYNIISGTSMACPHASGSAAYVKSFNPTWSAAAIKSALITTAKTMSPKKNKEAEFAYGAGILNPFAALKPGLVYDANETDYIKFLCGQGYNITKLISSSRCTSKTNGTIFDLNYPTFALAINATQRQFSATYHRTVTNVGCSNSTYMIHLNCSAGLEIIVDPQVLTFQSLSEKKSFVVTIQGKINKPLISASLMWTDGVHHVRSPIIVYAA